MEAATPTAPPAATYTVLPRDGAHAEALLCVVCNQPMTLPTELPCCGVRACRDCLTGRTTCPAVAIPCDAALPSPLTPPLKSVERMVAALEVVCDVCGITMAFQAWPAHGPCAKSCEACGETLLGAANVAGHDTLCPAALVPCDLPGCEVRVARKALEDHRREDHTVASLRAQVAALTTRVAALPRHWQATRETQVEVGLSNWLYRLAFAVPEGVFVPDRPVMYTARCEIKGIRMTHGAEIDRTIFGAFPAAVTSLIDTPDHLGAHVYFKCSCDAPLKTAPSGGFVQALVASLLAERRVEISVQVHVVGVQLPL
jgi:hypothetical protein